MNPYDVKHTIAMRAARELKDGQVVNLGIGIPTFVPQYIPKGISVTLHGENGILGIGPQPSMQTIDDNIFDAGGASVSILPGGCFLNSAESFALVRSGRVDVTILGALQVDAQGNLANWTIPGKMTVGFGGAMDLVCCAKTVIVAMAHTNKGKPKIMRNCTLPLTGSNCVRYIVTEMAFMEVTSDGIILREVAEGLTAADVQNATEAELIVPAHIGVMPIVS